MGEPIGQGHTQRVRWEEPLAALSGVGKGQLLAVPQRVRWEEPLAARQPEQIRSNAQGRERGAAPNPDEGSKAIGSRFASIPGQRACENTTESFVLFAIFIGENGLK